MSDPQSSASDVALPHSLEPIPQVQTSQESLNTSHPEPEPILLQLAAPVPEQQGDQ